VTCPPLPLVCEGRILTFVTLLALQDEKLDTIYLLTDGDPGRGEIDDPKQIVKSTAQLNSMRRVQINCISIGKESSLLK
jgi:hypothetical protein